MPQPKVYVVGKISTKTEMLHTTVLAEAYVCVYTISKLLGMIGVTTTSQYSIYTLEEWDRKGI